MSTITYSGIKSKNQWLLDHCKTITSENGEDGIIEKIFSVIGVDAKSYVDVGAWDGKYLSNTWYLYSMGWSGVLVEGEAEKINSISTEVVDGQKIEIINEFITKENPLHKLIAGTFLPQNFDLLSLDIDGYDYWVWHDLEEFKPRVVVIEINPTFNHDVVFIPSRDCAVNIGSSMRAMVELGAKKGYQLVAQVGANCIFVESCNFAKFDIDNNSCEELISSPWVPFVLPEENENYAILNEGPWGFNGWNDVSGLRPHEAALVVGDTRYKLPFEESGDVDDDISFLTRRVDQIVGALEVPASNMVKWCVEVGNWINHSPCRNVVKKYDYSNLSLTRDSEEFTHAECAEEAGAKNATRIKLGPDTCELTSVIASVDVSKEIAILALADSEKMDYWLWESLEEYRPNVVLMRINRSIPDNISLVTKQGRRPSYGASLSATKALAEKKNYDLIEVIGATAVFVASEKYHLLPKFDPVRSPLSNGNFPPIIFASMRGIYYNLSADYSEIRGVAFLPTSEVDDRLDQCLIRLSQNALQWKSKHMAHIKRQTYLRIDNLAVIKAKIDFMKERDGSDGFAWLYKFSKFLIYSSLVKIKRMFFNKAR